MEVIVLLRNTDWSIAMQTTLTSKGQVTIPRDVRQHFGLKQGMAVTFEIEGDHIALRPARAARQAESSGFGLIKSRRKAVPVDFDVASLITEAP
jgi:AbrB family looped-hinge helix DNA binding protein